jgi:hypothetical protein
VEGSINEGDKITIDLGTKNEVVIKSK